MKWHAYFYIPYTQELGDGFDSLAEAIKEVEKYKIALWNVEIVSDSFGIGGRHNVIWKGAWVNKRNGSTIEQEGWV